MTIDRSAKIHLPTWLVVFAVPILISLLTTLTVYAFSSGRQVQKVETLEKQVDRKVDKDVMILVQDQLNRIEKKLDDHMAK